MIANITNIDNPKIRQNIIAEIKQLDAERNEALEKLEGLLA